MMFFLGRGGISPDLCLDLIGSRMSHRNEVKESEVNSFEND